MIVIGRLRKNLYEFRVENLIIIRYQKHLNTEEWAFVSTGEGGCETESHLRSIRSCFSDAPDEQLRDRVFPVYVRRHLRDTAAAVEQLRRITISEEHINDNNSITSGCPICRINFELGEEDAFQTHCGHIYHTVCISTWLQFGNTCPACRRR